MSTRGTAADGGTREYRAAGTDLSERRRSGVARGSVIDLPKTPENTAITWREDGSARIGALATIAEIAADPRIAAAYPGIAAAADGLATPQIRNLATLGGNLAQRTRCWYYRNPRVACFKKGAATCPARAGNHLYGIVFDLGPCVAPHPSTMGAALMAYDAVVTTDRRSGMTVTELLGDGSSAIADNALADGEVIQDLQLGLPVPGERALYRRAISRSYAEWPLVEVVARAVAVDGVFRHLSIAAGGIAPVPIRLLEVEAAARAGRCDSTTIARAAELSGAGARPLPMTGYKLQLLKELVADLLRQLAA